MWYRYIPSIYSSFQKVSFQASIWKVSFQGVANQLLGIWITGWMFIPGTKLVHIDYLQYIHYNNKLDVFVLIQYIVTRWLKTYFSRIDARLKNVTYMIRNEAKGYQIN